MIRFHPHTHTQRASQTNAHIYMGKIQTQTHQHICRYCTKPVCQLFARESCVRSWRDLNVIFRSANKWRKGRLHHTCEARKKTELIEQFFFKRDWPCEWTSSFHTRCMSGSNDYWGICGEKKRRLTVTGVDDLLLTIIQVIISL